ncbi:hypothetical protein ES705_50837 [subsurface metagenome]
MAGIRIAGSSTTIFDRFDELLSARYSADHWEDDAKVHACDLIEDFRDHDWQKLGTVWAARSETWQERLAQVVSHGDTQYAVPLLLDMTVSGSDAVAVAAADSLRDHSEVFMGPKVLERLAALQEHAAYAPVVRDLIPKHG